MDDVSRILNKIVSESPQLQKMFHDMTPGKRKFDNLRWLYYDTGKRPRFRQQYMCYSTTRNKNGKFISWVYDWRGDKAGFYAIVEHVRRKDAKKRALRLYDQRMKQIKGG